MNEKPLPPVPGRAGSRMWWIPLALLVVAIVLLVMPHRPAPLEPGGSLPKSGEARAPLPAEVTVAQAAQLQADGSFLVDVRQPEEWAEGHIDGSTLIPLDDLDSRLAEIPKDRKIVVVCHSGNRSKHGRDLLLQKGYPQVASLSGGLSAWEAEGRSTVTGP